jgi:predicted RNA binding protein YcfA (HicA-like mRNA interferase family)
VGTSTMNELAAAGWLIYACDGTRHSYTHCDGRVVVAESYDELLNQLLKEVRGK